MIFPAETNILPIFADQASQVENLIAVHGIPDNPEQHLTLQSEAGRLVLRRGAPEDDVTYSVDYGDERWTLFHRGSVVYESPNASCEGLGEVCGPVFRRADLAESRRLHEVLTLFKGEDTLLVQPRQSSIARRAAKALLGLLPGF